MAPYNIILEPKQMFKTLHDLQVQTAHTIVTMYGVESVLQKASDLTYAIGFGELIKQAERDINHFGHAVVAANNAVNSACSAVVNQLVEKFAPEGAKSSYEAPPYKEIHLKTNPPTRVAIYVTGVLQLMEEERWRSTRFWDSAEKLSELYENTNKFWIGTSAENTRAAFKNKVEPQLIELKQVLHEIYLKGQAWIQEVVAYEASLGVH